jgi:hypothetical protein
MVHALRLRHQCGQRRRRFVCAASAIIERRISQIEIAGLAPSETQSDCSRRGQNTFPSCGFGRQTVRGPNIESGRSEHQPRRDDDCPGRARGRHAAARASVGRYAPQQPPPPITLLWRRRWSGSSPRAQRRWHDTRREDYEQRPQGVPSVRGRSPRGRGVRAVGVVGGADMARLNVPPGYYRTATALRVGATASNGLHVPCRRTTE